MARDDGMDAVSADEFGGDRALVVVAHPDDAEFWAAGTVAGWTGAGVEVSYLVLTDGDAGGFDPAVPRSQIPVIRREEQRRAAAVLGVGDVRFLGLAEGTLLQAQQRVRVEVVRAIRRVRPRRLVTWSPQWNWSRFRSCHPDHLATGTLVLHAVYPDAGNPFAWPELLEGEGLQPWTVEEIWLLNSPQPDRWVDVTGVFDRKVAAVGAHASQVAGRDLVGYLRGRAMEAAAGGGLAPGRLAEVFQVVLNR